MSVNYISNTWAFIDDKNDFVVEHYRGVMIVRKKSPPLWGDAASEEECKELVKLLFTEPVMKL